MKMFKKIMAVALVGVMALSMLTGCAVTNAIAEDKAEKALENACMTVMGETVNFKSLIGNGINNGYILLCLCYMILCIICDCSGIYLRNVNCLILVGDIGMYGDLDLLICKRLKCNNCLRCYDTCIECKDYINTSLGLFRSECGACSYLLAINQDWLFSLLIHQGSGYGILFSR